MAFGIERGFTFERGNMMTHISSFDYSLQCQDVSFHSTIKNVEVMKQKYLVGSNIIRFSESDSRDHGVIKKKRFSLSGE